MAAPRDRRHVRQDPRCFVAQFEAGESELRAVLAEPGMTLELKARAQILFGIIRAYQGYLDEACAFLDVAKSEVEDPFVRGAFDCAKGLVLWLEERDDDALEAVRRAE
jgi:hypothetical protein